jgi:hypothetical protein
VVAVLRIFANPARGEMMVQCATSENGSPPTDLEVAKRSSQDQLSAPVQITVLPEEAIESAITHEVSPPAQYWRSSKAVPWRPTIPCLDVVMHRPAQTALIAGSAVDDPPNVGCS